VIRFGYACINLSVPGTFRSTIQRSVIQLGTPFLRHLVKYNFHRTKQIILWNIANDMPLYRISSDLVPFGSHELAKDLHWWEDPELILISQEVKQLVREHNLRITIHPGQYNNLGSPYPDVIKKTFSDLEYQTRLLEFFGGTDMILHVGGRYESKENSIGRFRIHYSDLPDNTKKYFRLENDDKIYTIADVMDLCLKEKITPMYDYHHALCAPSLPPEEVCRLLPYFWSEQRIKVHLSTGATSRRDRKHAPYVSVETWEEFKHYFGDLDIDVMLEAKNKNLAVFALQRHEGLIT
jgi:UV DNA damage endonuclease